MLRQVILLEHEIPHGNFSGKVLACLPPEDWTITPENSAGRRDLRHLPVLSIDPPGCKDIDDALHARQLENGNIEVHETSMLSSAYQDLCYLRGFWINTLTDIAVKIVTRSMTGWGAHCGRHPFRVCWICFGRRSCITCHVNISGGKAIGYVAWPAHGDIVLSEAERGQVSHSIAMMDIPWDADAGTTELLHRYVPHSFSGGLSPASSFSAR